MTNNNPYPHQGLPDQDEENTRRMMQGLRMTAPVFQPGSGGYTAVPDHYLQQHQYQYQHGLQNQYQHNQHNQYVQHNQQYQHPQAYCSQDHAYHSQPLDLQTARSTPPAQSPTLFSLPQARNYSVSPSQRIPAAPSAAPKVIKLGASSSDPPKPAKTPEPPKVSTKQPAKPAPSKNCDNVSKDTNPIAPNISKNDLTKSADVRRDFDAVTRDQNEIDEEILHDIYGKEHINVVFIGHVDAGKSTMGGNILFLTGMVDKRTMEKYEREAKEASRETWYLSWALDSTKEERSKGKTVEVGRAYFETEKRRYTILDAPGHKTYVPNMIGGAAQADIGVLVISARKGEYETGFEKGGQTREHAVLAKTQGVNKLVVVINKMDDPTVAWSKERYDECVNGLTKFLKNTGYNPKTDIMFMPVSGYTGVNIKDRLTKNICQWYNGPSLIEYLDNVQMLARKLNAPFLMPIGGKYKDMGTVIEGKIESGGIRKGHSLMIMPNKAVVEVTAIYNETEAEVESAFCGDQVRLRLRGIEEEDIFMGSVLCCKANPVSTVTSFEAQISILDLKNLLTAGYTCVMHIHTAVEEVTFGALLHKLDRTNRRSKKAPAFATKGMKLIARLDMASPIAVEKYTFSPAMGRFTLRDQGTTVAIGKITKLLTNELSPTIAASAE
ncbi:Eukaryotic peptide chain release factor GTP-binding subunit [Neolecta irregularis DAH-3]|uniref:Eukaryotic peptide chain release factor GTP-binding subunit n=1 Tax=Neolecta irregularis (strain DAH-3) TaxID=1198029 RepID=A0A1U7LVR5_NEOID|nr:Eukaryotic peptide chain release factor GTP-binding subunit [Neolecta irregularis DAH-3]|eukprot:OLL26757.1 Eukaryotic peptide chain release factor GTP-binding subunit [Neolecta irregularis DAH-3]